MLLFSFLEVNIALKTKRGGNGGEGEREEIKTCEKPCKDLLSERYAAGYKYQSNVFV